MRLNFCTLFDNNYLLQGLALHQSLCKHAPSFNLFILCFDEESKKNLQKLSLESVTIITLAEFEDEELLKVKPTRTRAEYCWTCSASIIRYCIKKFNLDHCTYVDADVFFLKDPAALYQEMGDKEVAITSHNYDPVYDRSVSSGEFCIQYVTFFNKHKAMALLEQWRTQCIEWCYARHEEGKFGDQMYLDPWPSYDFVHVIKQKGAGMAPWNVNQFKPKAESYLFRAEEPADLVFYHFHGLKVYRDLSFVYTLDYYLPGWVKVAVYETYCKILSKQWENLTRTRDIVFPELKVFPEKSSLIRTQFLKIKSNIFILAIIMFTKNKHKLRFDPYLFKSIHYIR